LAHNSNSNNRKNPNQQQQKYAIYQSINQWSKERKKERINGAALPLFSSVTLPPHREWEYGMWVIGT
jgi:hypothetical protein